MWERKMFLFLPSKPSCPAGSRTNVNPTSIHFSCCCLWLPWSCIEQQNQKPRLGNWERNRKEFAWKSITELNLSYFLSTCHYYNPAQMYEFIFDHASLTIFSISLASDSGCFHLTQWPGLFSPEQKAFQVSWNTQVQTAAQFTNTKREQKSSNVSTPPGGRKSISFWMVANIFIRYTSQARKKQYKG